MTTTTPAYPSDEENGMSYCTECARQSAEIAELRQLNDGLMAASNNGAAEMAQLREDVKLFAEQLTERNQSTVRLEAELAEARREAASRAEWANRAAENYRVQHATMSATIDSLRADLALARLGNEILARQCGELRADLERVRAQIDGCATRCGQCEGAELHTEYCAHYVAPRAKENEDG